MLPKKAIEEFQEIYKAENGKEISFEEASVKAPKLLRLFRLITEPIPDDWLKKLQKD